MLVIKMLKKAAGMNNNELAEYLGKTRNTISSWEADENNIPLTEKKRLSNRFNFDFKYWNIGLNEAAYVYKKMYSDIKNGYLNDMRDMKKRKESRIDEILNMCDSIWDYSNIDEIISNSSLFNKNEDGIDDDYFVKLKKWRKEKSEEENVKAFQVLSDDVLKNIIKKYKDNKDLSNIKNFPVNGIKWNKYYHEILDILESDEYE